MALHQRLITHSLAVKESAKMLLLPDTDLTYESLQGYIKCKRFEHRSMCRCTAFEYYSTGIIKKGCCTNLDHGVILVGLNVDAGTAYWRINNSWDASWRQAKKSQTYVTISAFMISQ